MLMLTLTAFTYQDLDSTGIQSNSASIIVLLKMSYRKEMARQLVHVQ